MTFLIKGRCSLFYILLSCFTLGNFNTYGKSTVPISKIIITADLDLKDNKTGIEIQFMKTNLLGIRSVSWESPLQNLAGRSNGQTIKWELETPNAIRIRLDALTGKGYLFLIEPGDSVHLIKDGNAIRYTGRGSEKFNLVEKLNNLPEPEQKPQNDKFYSTRSITDYLEWSQYLNYQEIQANAILDTYKSKINTYAWNDIKASVLAAIERTRMLKFGGLLNLTVDDSTLVEPIIPIYDTTMVNKNVRWLNEIAFQNENSSYYYDYIRNYVRRKYGFKNYPNGFFDDLKRFRMFYNEAKDTFKGPNLYSVLTYLLTEKMMKENIWSRDTKDMLADYKQIDMPGDIKKEYLKYVAGFKATITRRSIQMGFEIPDFRAENVNGQSLKKDDLKRKTILVNFLNPKVTCKENSLAELYKIQSAFNGNSDVAIVNMLPLAAKAQWKNNTDKACIQEHTLFFYNSDSVLVDFDVHSFPASYLVNHWGGFIESPFTLSKDNTAQIIDLIRKEIDLSYDGPYVEYQKGNLLVTNISPAGVKQKKETADKVMLSVPTNYSYTAINVKLKKLPASEPGVYQKAEKVFALSDIEGNLVAFRKLLLANGIMDTELNWTFGKGHLVFAGDMFDRGDQVTECLWLVYTLEEKAKAAGGYVHFVLGNHEIMNLQGDHRYADKKYKDNTKLIGKTLAQLYNEDTELGRWLRTKNIVEQIGDLLFMHGGFSQELNNLDLSVDRLNALARPFYADAKAALNANKNVVLLYDGSNSPFWYRLYYSKDRFSNSQNKWLYRAKESQVDSTLRKFNVRHIITGHTIIADTISTHYHNKVINTDTKHAKGKSEALLIEGGNFYRVNDEGKRMLLFRDEDK